MLSLFQKKQRAKRPSAQQEQKPAVPQRSLQDVLKGYAVPSFPKTVMQVLRKFKEPDASLASIAAQLERDPGMSVRLLKIVNSAAFGLRKNVSHVGRAVTLLGPARVEALVVSVAVKVILPTRVTPYFNGHSFWRLSSRRASLARALAERLHPGTASEAFTAGMLQDLALPVLVDLHKEAYGEVYQEYLASPDADLSSLERAKFGYDHAAIGMMIAKQWELPPYLIDAIGGHHGGQPDLNVEPAIRMVAELRDNTRQEDLVEQVLTNCGQGMTLDAARSLVAKAFEDAAAFQKAMG